MKHLLTVIKTYHDKKKNKHMTPKAHLLCALVLQFMYGCVVFMLVIHFLSLNFHPSYEEFLTMVKSFDASTYIGVALAMLGYLKIKNVKNYPIALAASFSLVLAVSSQLITLIPVDINMSDAEFSRQTAVFLPLLMMFVSVFCIAVNLAWAIFQSVDIDNAASN
ncbi:hypothetical protein [Chromohalobacter sp.]|uniref:hypothetical protein n=1 Tax=Chromohalobacter sp. TaxID=50740 RepID=UPI003242B179